MKRNLYFKILSSYLLVAFVLVSLLGLIGASVIREKTTLRAGKELRGYAKTLALRGVVSDAATVALLANTTGCRVTMIGSEGEVLADSEGKLPLENHLNRPEVVEARLRGTGEAIRHSATVGNKEIYVAQAVFSQEGELQGYIRVARPFVEVEEAIGTLVKLLLIVSIVSLVPCLFLSLIILRRAVEPVRRIERYTAQIVKGEDPGTLIVPEYEEFQGLVRNVNEMFAYQREKRSQLREERRRFAAIFTSMEEGVMLLGDGLRIEEINPSMLRLLAQTREDAIGRAPLEVLRSGELMEAISRHLASGENQTLEVHIAAANSIFWEVNVTSIAAATGDGKKVVIVARDISRLKGLERSRSDFVANIAHELKTPLSSIAGFSQMLARGEVEEEKRQEFLEKIVANSARLNRLTEDLLTLFELEFGPVPCKMEQISLTEVVAEAISSFNDKAEEKKLVIVNNCAATAITILADREKVLTALGNVLSNAIRYTERGKVTMEAQTEAGFAVVGVTDTGEGIAARFLPRLGERFFRVDGARSRQLGGTGLGLAIVKHAMRLLGGRMEIRSAPGEGTTVRLFFPSVE